jgi:REJ domain
VLSCLLFIPCLPASLLTYLLFLLAYLVTYFLTDSLTYLIIISLPYLLIISTTQWTCTIASIKDFGTDCEFFGALNSSTNGILNVPENVMSPSISYSIVVQVSSPDGRIARKTVTVNPSLAGGVKVSISNTIRTFNIGSKQVLVGLVTSANAATSTWTVTDVLGTAVPYTALTVPRKDFLAFDTASEVAYPLSFRKGDFVGGGTYTFKLTAHPTDDPTLVTYSEIVLIANIQPNGGYVTSTPASGRAVITQFLISTPGWTTDAASMPLSYSFSYRLTPSAPYLTLAASSIRAFTTSTLPAGLSQLNNTITVRAKATDIFQSSATAVTAVAVKIDKSADLTLIATTALNKAFLIGDINLVYQTVNNVRHVLLCFAHTLVLNYPCIFIFIMMYCIYKCHQSFCSIWQHTLLDNHTLIHR